MKKNKIWIWTFSGHIIQDLENPSVDDICIEDISHSLSRICRYNGHCRQFYSVAQHSVLTSRAIPNSSKPLKLWALLHDAAEAYLCDIPSPLKGYLSPKYDGLEKKYLRVICERFGLCGRMPQLIIRYDRILLMTERRDLVKEQSMKWGYECLPLLPDKIIPWSIDSAESNFLLEFYRLTE